MNRRNFLTLSASAGIAASVPVVANAVVEPVEPIEDLRIAISCEKDNQYYAADREWYFSNETKVTLDGRELGSVEYANEIEGIVIHHVLEGGADYGMVGMIKKNSTGTVKIHGLTDDQRRAHIQLCKDYVYQPAKPAKNNVNIEINNDDRGVFTYEEIRSLIDTNNETDGISIRHDRISA